MKFNYQARNKKGEIQSGTIEASSEEAVISLLQKHELFLTSLEKVGRGPFYFRKIKIFSGISRKEIVLFSRQLSIMFKSKIPPVEAFYAIAKQTKNLNFREKILDITEEISGGTQLSKALSSYPKLFSHFYIAMVKSGEASGNLAEAIDYLADHLEKEDHLSSQLKGAMIYPIFVLFIFLIIVGAMIFFVIPNLTEVLEETGAELPSLTKTVISVSVLLKSWGWVFILFLFGIIFFIFRFLKTTQGKKLSDRISLKIPVLGSLLEKIYLSRFAENLSTLISGGIPIARALEITGEVVGNDVYKTIILKARDEVKTGEAISQVLERYPVEIPPLFIQMVSVGEQTGTLDKSLMSIVDFYRKEVEQSLTNFLQLLEPILIVFLGLIVAGLMAAIVLPLYQIGIR